METRASYVIVGGFVVGLALALFAFVIWLSQAKLDRQWEYYRVEFKGSVSGLSQGSPVRYRGVPVGSVVSIKINQDQVELIEVNIRVDGETPVNIDTVATLEMQGIAGGVYLELTGGANANAPRLAAKPGQRYPLIKSRPPAQLFSEAPQLLDSTNQLVARAQLLFSDHNLASIAQMLDNLKDLSGALAEKKGDIQATLTEARAMAQSMHEAANNANALLKGLSSDERKLTADATPMLANLRRMSEKLDSAAEKLDAMLAENRGPFHTILSDSAVQVGPLLSETRQMVEGLSRLLNKFEADPARFLFGDQQQGIPVK